MNLTKKKKTGKANWFSNKYISDNNTYMRIGLATSEFDNEMDRQTSLATSESDNKSDRQTGLATSESDKKKVRQTGLLFILERFGV